MNKTLFNNDFSILNTFETKYEKIAYRYLLTDPSRPYLLFIHGNMSSSYMWSNLVDLFKDRYNILCPDLKGFGNSSYNQALTGLEDYSDEIYELLNFLKITKVIILGLSLGGPVCMHFCAKYKEIAHGLVLFGSVGIKGYYFKRVDYQGKVLEEKMPDKEFLEKDPNAATYLMCLQTKNYEFMQILLEKFLFNVGRSISDSFFKKIIEEAFLQKNYIDSLWAINIFNISDSFNGISKGTNDIEKIECPTLIIHGSKDKIIPVKESVAIFHSLKSKKKYIEILENYGHVPHLDNAEKVSEILKKFLEEIL